MFGLNHAWHGGQTELTSQFTDRVTLSPHAAKRSALPLSDLVRQHEDRLCVLPLEAPTS